MDSSIENFCSAQASASNWFITWPPYFWLFTLFRWSQNQIEIKVAVLLKWPTWAEERHSWFKTLCSLIRKRAKRNPNSGSFLIWNNGEDNCCFVCDSWLNGSRFKWRRTDGAPYSSPMLRLFTDSWRLLLPFHQSAFRIPFTLIPVCCLAAQSAAVSLLRTAAKVNPALKMTSFVV